jgi:hypothetical protein
MTDSDRHSTKGTMSGSAMKDDGLEHGYRATASSAKPPKPPVKPPAPPSGQGGGSKSK